MVSSLLLWALLLLPIVPAKRFAEWLFPRAEMIRLFFVALWFYIIIIQIQMQVLGVLGLMALPGALALGGATALGALWLPRPGQRLDVGALIKERFAAATPPERVAAVLLMLPTLYALMRLAGDGPYFMWDDWAYHGPVVTGMMRSDSVHFFRNNFAMYYPFNPHLLVFYTTLATGDLQWVWLPTVYWIFVGSVAWMVLALAAPARCLEFFLLGGAIFGMSQEVRWFQNAFCSTDVFGAIGLFSAFAVARPREGADDDEVRANALFCGMLIGYTIGTKNFFVVPGVGAAATCLYWSTWGRRLAERGTTAHLTMGGWVFGLGLLGTFITGSFWYFYNLLIAGNPVFPVKMLGFDGVVKARYFRKTTMYYFGERAQWSWDFWRDALSQWLLWPEPHGVMLNLGLVGGVVICGVAAWRVWWRKKASPVPLGMMPGMILGAAILLGAYPFLPYSGTFIGTDYLVISRRYLLFCFMVALAFWAYLAGTTLRGRKPMARVIRILFYLMLALEWPLLVWYKDYLYLKMFKFLKEAPYVTFSWLETESGIAWQLGNNYRNIGWDVYGWSLAVVGIIALLAVRLAPGTVQRLEVMGRLKMPILGGVAVGLLALAIVRPMVHPGPYRTFYPRWDTVQLARGANAVDQLPPDSRVGGLGGSMWEQWYLHGSRGQLEPVYLQNNGKVLEELHTAYRRGLIDPDDDDTQPRIGVPPQGVLLKPELFPERLRASTLDYLFVTQYAGGWPPQREIVRTMEDFKLIYEDGYCEIYQHLESPDEPLTKLPPAETLGEHLPI